MGHADGPAAGRAGPRLTTARPALSDLRERIVRLIEAAGPLSVADYMGICLYDASDGYYTTREPFGASGDFTTAPEISQMFGELVAVWLLTAWRASGRPMPAVLAEIGPGRGTLMMDVARGLARLDPATARDIDYAMVETSPRLAAVQRETLGALASSVSWVQAVGQLPRKPLFIVGNELFDAVPVRQYVKLGGAWLERAVGLDGAGRLAFVPRPGGPDPSALPADASAAPEGAVVEMAPARAALMEIVARRIAEDGGAGLFFDYGYLKPAVGDTLQAMSRHAYVDPLADPGRADLTAHVDFAALAAAAEAHGLDVHLATQGEFLLGMGLLERAGSLGARADQATRRRLQEEVERLAGPEAMGSLFKAMVVAPAGTSLPPFVRPD